MLKIFFLKLIFGPPAPRKELTRNFILILPAPGEVRNRGGLDELCGRPHLCHRLPYFDPETMT